MTRCQLVRVGSSWIDPSEPVYIDGSKPCRLLIDNGKLSLEIEHADGNQKRIDDVATAIAEAVNKARLGTTVNQNTNGGAS